MSTHKKEVIWAHSEIVGQEGGSYQEQNLVYFDLGLPNLQNWKMNLLFYLLFKPPNLWYLVIAARAKTCLMVFIYFEAFIYLLYAVFFQIYISALLTWILF